MEKNGMDYADCIMCVSELTRRTVIEQYHQNPKKVFAMHNAVYPLSQEYQDIPRPDHSKENDCDIPWPHHHAKGTGILCGSCFTGIAACP